MGREAGLLQDAPPICPQESAWLWKTVDNPKGVMSMSKKNSEVTSKSVASKAGKLLQNPKTPKSVKAVAASALTQRPNKR